MTQPTLFRRGGRPLRLPVSGNTIESRAASQEAADHAAVRRPRLQERYLALLLRAGAVGLTDWEAAEYLSCPVSSICSTRAGLRGQLAPHGHRLGPYHERNTVWALRVVLDVPLDPEVIA